MSAQKRSQRSLRTLNVQELLHALEESRKSINEDGQAELIAEALHRIDEGDFELDAFLAERLQSQAKAKLLDPVPESLLSLAPADLSRISASKLNALWNTCRAQLDFTAGIDHSQSDWLTKALFDSRRSFLQGCFQRLEKEFARRAIIPEVVNSPGNRATTAAKKNPDVAKRRAIIGRNAGSFDFVLCKQFDLESVPIPDKWEKHSVSTWSEAYKKPELRSRIHTIISKDKKAR